MKIVVKNIDGVRCLSEDHKKVLEAAGAETFINTVSWSHVAKCVLRVRRDRARMYANLREPVMTIARLMKEDPKRFEVSLFDTQFAQRFSSSYSFRSVIENNYRVVDGLLGLSAYTSDGSIDKVTCNVLDYDELIYLMPYVEKLIVGYEEAENKIKVAATLQKESEEKEAKEKGRAELSAQYEVL